MLTFRSDSHPYYKDAKVKLNTKILLESEFQTLQDAERTSTPTPSDTCIDDNLKSVKEYSM